MKVEIGQAAVITGAASGIGCSSQNTFLFVLDSFQFSVLRNLLPSTFNISWSTLQMLQ